MTTPAIAFQIPDAGPTVLAAFSAVGGKTNADWLVGIARGEGEQSLRRKAVALAERAGATGSALGALLDTVSDTEMRSAVISALAQEGSNASRDKLMAIATSSETPSVRRRAISALERFDSAEVREALAVLGRALDC